MNFLNDIGWVDITYLHNIGLRDSTIEKLIQENSSFQRIKNNTVEYDRTKVYGHPKIRAVLNKSNCSGVDLNIIDS